MALSDGSSDVGTPADVTAFVKESTAQLRDLLALSGKVIYSAAATLGPGEIYFLGINPGGTPGVAVADSIAENLKAFPTKTCNDYLDEVWPPHSRPLQNHVVDVFTRLHYKEFKRLPRTFSTSQKIPKGTYDSRYTQRSSTDRTSSRPFLMLLDAMTSVVHVAASPTAINR